MICAGSLLFWLGRDAPFGKSTVETALTVNPIATALNVLQTPGFTEYDLVPANWWVTGSLTFILFVVLMIQTARLTRPH